MGGGVGVRVGGGWGWAMWGRGRDQVLGQGRCLRAH